MHGAFTALCIQVDGVCSLKGTSSIIPCNQRHYLLSDSYMYHTGYDVCSGASSLVNQEVNYG